MADVVIPAVRIDRLNLRIPGESAASGRRVANRVIEHLAAKLSPDLRVHLGAVSLRVPVSVDADELQVSEAVAGAVANALDNAATGGRRMTD